VPFSFASMEGFLGAKIAVEAARRAGPNVTRARLVAALRTMGEYNLGGVYINYGPQAKKGWGGVDLTIMNASGNLQK
jgi:branched-chain amino acid transport system substrate-binding protein